MEKYNILISILDAIRFEAPVSYKSYYYKKQEQLDYARSKAFIHLYLKVKFWILDFIEREKLITDWSNDWWIDWYYIDDDNKFIYLIQSKYRLNAYNFDNKKIQIDEIFKIDFERITSWEIKDEKWTEYNWKIQKLIKDIQNIEWIARYKYRIILLGNIDYSEKIKNLIWWYEPEIFNYEKTYNELIFPVVSWTYFYNNDLFININTTWTLYRIEYPVTLSEGNCTISVVFIPTLEIAKIMNKYKNSLLKYNPRSFLELSKNPVNKSIKSSIVDKETNEFALYNNGITIFSEETNFQDKAWRKWWQIYIKNPQIINWWQTAFTLSEIFSDLWEINLINKEVIVKIITFENEWINNDRKIEIIKEISNATNNQSKIDDSDKVSNESIQIELQKLIFDNFGYFYERKKWEFYDWVKSWYISKDQIIEREPFLRVCYAINSPTSSKTLSKTFIFDIDNINDFLINVRNEIYKYIYWYEIYKKLNKIKSNLTKYWNWIKYWKYAITYVVVNKFIKSKKEYLDNDLDKFINDILSKWLVFEKNLEEKLWEIDYYWIYRTKDVEKEINTYFDIK